MLTKKYTIQKSIRFLKFVETDLAVLAKELNRTQNELVNIAVENLLKENRAYFKKYIIVDYLGNFFDGKEDEKTVNINSLYVIVKRLRDETTEKYVVILNEKDDASKKEYGSIEDLYNMLVDYADKYIGLESEDVQRYLDARLCYD